MLGENKTCFYINNGIYVSCVWWTLNKCHYVVFSGITEVKMLLISTGVLPKRSLETENQGRYRYAVGPWWWEHWYEISGLWPSDFMYFTVSDTKLSLSQIQQTWRTSRIFLHKCNYLQLERKGTVAIAWVLITVDDAVNVWSWLTLFCRKIFVFCRHRLQFKFFLIWIPIPLSHIFLIPNLPQI